MLRRLNFVLALSGLLGILGQAGRQSQPPSFLVEPPTEQEIQENTAINAGHLLGERVLDYPIGSVSIVCYPDHVTIALDRRKFRDLGIFLSRQVSLRDRKTCNAAKSSNETHFILVTLYKFCRTTKIPKEDRILYENDIIFNMINSSNDEDSKTLRQRFQCRHYLNIRRPLSDSTSTAPALTYSKQPVTITSHSQGRDDEAVASGEELNYRDLFQLFVHQYAWDQNAILKFPFPVSSKDRLFIAIQLTPGIQSAQHIKPLPAYCYLSPNSDPTNRDSRHYLLTEGCPVDESTATIISTRQPSRLAKNTAQIDSKSRFSFLPNPYFQKPIFFLHCELDFCHYNQTTHVDKKCPTSRQCSSIIEVGEWNEFFKFSHTQVFVSSGPFVLLPSEEKPEAASTESVDCQECLTKGNTSRRTEDRSIVVVNGVSTEHTILVAILAFLIGAALVAILVYIQKKTAKTLPNQLTSPHYAQEQALLRNGTAANGHLTDVC